MALGPAKRSGVLWKILIVIIGVVIVARFVMGGDNKPVKVELTPAQKAEKQKDDARVQQVQLIAMIVKKSMREPESVRWDFIGANDDASVVCMKYRGKNGFGGVSVENASYANGKLSTSKSAWNKSCAGKSLNDDTGVSSFL